MNTDELKIISDLVQVLGATSKDAFILYLLLDRVLPVVGRLLAFAGLLWVGVFAIRHYSDKTLEQVRNLLGIGTSGHVNNGEKLQIIKRIQELLQK